jgi:hypothetical protein
VRAGLSRHAGLLVWQLFGVYPCFLWRNGAFASSSPVKSSCTQDGDHRLQIVGSRRSRLSSGCLAVFVEVCVPHIARAAAELENGKTLTCLNPEIPEEVEEHSLRDALTGGRLRERPTNFRQPASPNYK